MLFVVFIVTFLFSAGSMVMTFMRGASIDSSAKRRPARKPRLAPKAAAAALAPAPKKRRKRRKGDELDRAMSGSEDFVLAEPDDMPDEPAHEPAPEPEEAVETAVGTGVESLSPHAEKQKAYMMDFLSDALQKTGSDTQKMDNFNKFGVNLFLAGACETLADKRDLDEKSRAKVLADSVRVIGFKKSHAGAF
ncbi:MAG: hypothetical protein VW405_21355, partial [Rhodospirillaceae bacterium]